MKTPSEIPLASPLKEKLLRYSDSHQVIRQDEVQSLWSGYGSIVRYLFDNAKTLVVKQIDLAGVNHHPVGWNTDISHQRKLKSYQVEEYFYKNYVNQLPLEIPLPHCYEVFELEGVVYIIMQDLVAEGYDQLKSTLHPEEFQRCLKWLAHFHAFFLKTPPEGLWEIGTYWHLATRPDELVALNDPKLKEIAPELDRILNTCPYQTLVHGDAKVANFCFDDQLKRVAAVDFQYIGQGVGVKDLAYFVGSVYSENDCQKYESKILEEYFTFLRQAISEYHPDLKSEIDQIENHWRSLYPIAWADFHRFLKGWSPGHWKINSYSESICRKVYETLK